MPKFFDYNIPTIEQINSANGRRYSTPEGKFYPSVTSVLSVEENPHITAWRKRVGEAEADRISKQATTKGSKVHEACENYLQGKPTQWNLRESEAQEAFSVFIPVLDSVEEVHAMETRMWSDKLEVAGTVDLIARINGEMYVVDYKTSSRYKRKEDISDYFIQCAFYSLMFWERTGILISKIKILIDTREQMELRFQPVVGVEIVHQCLKTGDYSATFNIQGKEVESSTICERKGFSDLWNSYTGDNYNRERCKFLRCKELGKTFILAVEGTTSDILKGYTYTKGGVDYESKKDGISMSKNKYSGK
jgi:genome maintenance exonuclease 1